jgi:hypothetical protein
MSRHITWRNRAESRSPRCPCHPIARLGSHAEVTEDSDGPVEWCWPVPGDQAAAIAGRFPDLTLRTEPAHQEAFIHLGQRQPAGAGWQAVGDAPYRWTLEQHRTPNGAPG